jgi:hypothetical protein
MGDKISEIRDSAKVLSRVGCGYRCTDEDQRSQQNQKKESEMFRFSHADRSSDWDSKPINVTLQC